mmetsp:Transcript_4978/g.5490  ORF Transcript_4978/g.5490 Transcript_4978/m.5490 type:complete len:440 (+) Transcript_4978:148-1467(+)
MMVLERMIGKKDAMWRIKLTSQLLLMYFAMLLMMSDMVFDVLHKVEDYSITDNRKLSISLGNGNCKWTGSRLLTLDDDVYGTLLASYPASGMRVLWQQVSGLAGINVRDDFFELYLPKIGIVKTQYPHYEGIWSYGSNLAQTIYLIRNPRWAMPSYHTLLSEIGYAHSWELAYSEVSKVFEKRAPMEDWTRWRDYRFDDEINLWGFHIDYYMGNGTQYWFDYDFERNGQTPFRFRTEEERPWPKDSHCIYDSDCAPKAVISYEYLRDSVKGPAELKKIADVLRGKAGYEEVLEDEAIDCIWHETWVNAPEPSNDNRDLNGLPSEAYNFTLPQMYKIEDKLQEMIAKYEGRKWAANPVAMDLVDNFRNYQLSLSAEISDMEVNPPPTPVHDANYQKEIKEWYQSLGKGNRYDKSKIQDMGIWDQVSHFYEDDDTEESSGP